MLAVFEELIIDENPDEFGILLLTPPSIVIPESIKQFFIDSKADKSRDYLKAVIADLYVR